MIEFVLFFHKNYVELRVRPFGKLSQGLESIVELDGAGSVLACFVYGSNPIVPVRRTGGEVASVTLPTGQVH